MQKFPCRSDTFSVLTPEACYWLGVLAADGCVRIKGKNSQIIVLKMTVDSRRRLPLYSIQPSGLQVRRLTHELYSDCCTALDRKLAIAEKVMTSEDVRLDGVTAKGDTGACEQNLDL